MIEGFTQIGEGPESIITQMGFPSQNQNKQNEYHFSNVDPKKKSFHQLLFESEWLWRELKSVVGASFSGLGCLPAFKQKSEIENDKAFWFTKSSSSSGSDRMLRCN